MHDGLDLGRSLDAGEIERLPATAGLYAIWREGSRHCDYYDTLLYVGKTDPAKGGGIRQRIRDYLTGKRPNETLYFWVIDLLVRPNLAQDTRPCAAIAAGYLTECQFAGWAWDGTSTLSQLEAQVQRNGVWGEVPVLNSHGRKSGRIDALPGPVRPPGVLK
jgi:hypothetical protein